MICRSCVGVLEAKSPNHPFLNLISPHLTIHLRWQLAAAEAAGDHVMLRLGVEIVDLRPAGNIGMHRSHSETYPDAPWSLNIYQHWP